MSATRLNLVTGATGQLGSHIVEQLRDAGETVRVLVRPGRDLSFLQQQGAEIVERLRAAGEAGRVWVRPGRALSSLEQQGAEMVEGASRDSEAVKRAAA